MRGIFDGVRVLDFGSVLSGPSVTRLLAEQGADVIKVELPPAGDISRGLPAVRNGRSGYFVQQNRGKRCICVNAKDPRGRDLLLELVETVDVMVQNFSAGVIERLGLGWETVSARNPRLVMCSITAFGTEGPLRDQPGYDAIAQAYGGILHMNGTPGESPALMGLSPGDVLTGAHGYGAVAAALYHRERTGRGQRIDLSLLGCYMTCHEINIQAWSVSDGRMVPERAGSLHPFVGAYGVFPVGDEFVMIAAANDRQWQSMCRAMDRPDLAGDERFATMVDRTDHCDEVNRIVAKWLSEQPDRDTAIATMLAEHVPAAPVLSVQEAATHPHMRSTGIVRRIEDDRAGEMLVPGNPLRFSDFPDDLELHARDLGADNEAVLMDLPTMDPARYEQLSAEGVLVSDPDPTAPSARSPR